MPVLCRQPAKSVLRHKPNHSSFPAMPHTVVARSGGLERSPGRRGSASPWMGASTAGCLRRAAMTVSTATLIVCVLLCPDVGAVAQTTPPNAAAGITSAADPWAAFITEASQRFGVPTHWIRAVMQAESAGEARAVSPKGAIGLMQIMPETYTELRARHDLGADPYDPRDNILAGAAFLREMHDRFGAPGFLAAYNAGPGRYEEHLATGRPLPEETRAYLAALGPIIGAMPPIDTLHAAADPLAWTHAPIFVGRAEVMTSDDRLTSDKPSDRAPIARQPVDLSAIAPRSDGLFVRRADAVRR